MYNTFNPKENKKLYEKGKNILHDSTVTSYNDINPGH